MAPSPRAVVGTGLLVVVAALIGVPILSSFNQATSPTEGSFEFVQTNVGLDGTNTVEVTDGDARNETVFISRGQGVRLTGASDSEVSADSSFEVIQDNNWTVSQWAAVDASATGETMAAVSFGGEAILAYNGSDGDWVAYYYDESNRESYRLTANATSPTALTNLQLVANKTDLALYINATVQNTTPLTGGNAAVPDTTQHWEGVIDETRGFSRRLVASERTRIYSKPSLAFLNGSRSVRVMYDDADADSQQILFESGSVTLSNTSLVAGLPEVQVAESDYQFDNDEVALQPDANTNLADAPVAYLDLELKITSLDSLLNAFSAMVGLLAPLLVVIVAAAIVGVVTRLR